MYFDDPAAVLPTCIERLGERAGRQYAAMARRGFLLKHPTEQTPPSGLCRLGGPALLDPGTPWPERGGTPLSLLAVLDISALAGWLGTAGPLPAAAHPVLLNFFYADPDVPYDEYRQLEVYSASPTEASRVISADPASAREASAPAPARSYPPVPVHAAEVTMLPDMWDVQDSDIEFDRERFWAATELLLDAMYDLDANTADTHAAFGWPDTSHTSQNTARDAGSGVPDVHLLQLAGDPDLAWAWGDATLYFTIPATALAAGDYTQAKLAVQSS